MSASSASSKAPRASLWWAAAALAFLPAVHLAPVDFDRGAVLLFAPVAIAALLGLDGASSSSFPRTERWLAGFFLVVVALGTALSSHWAAALALLSAWFWTVAFALGIRRLRPSEAEVRLLLIAIAAGGVVGAALVAGASPNSSGVPFPIYGNPRLMGLHLLCGALATTALLGRRGDSFRGSAVVAVVALPVWIALFWTGGRAPVLGLSVGIAACLWSAAPASRLRLGIHFALLGLVAVGLSLLVPPLGAAVGLAGAWERSSEATSLTGMSSGRLDFWGITLRHALEAPWLGHGADAYNFLRPRQDGNQPHNFLLQWFGDFGLAGFAAICALVSRAWWRGTRRAAGAPENDWGTRAGWIGASGLLVTGLLDGVFYHAIVLIPTALFFGLLPASNPEARTSGPESKLIPRAMLAALGLATIVLAAHQYLFFSLIARPPDSPQAAAPRLLRVFPSTTNALWRWLDHWKKQDPDTALEWARWAQEHSHAPALYHDFAGKLWIERGDLDAAEAEYRAALRVTHYTGSPRFEKILDLIAKARAEREGKTTASGASPAPSR